MFTQIFRRKYNNLQFGIFSQFGKYLKFAEKYGRMNFIQVHK